MEYRVLELGERGAVDLGVVAFSERPQAGEILHVQVGSAVAVFVIDSIVHKAALGRASMVVRVRRHEVADARPIAPRRPIEEPQALPPAFRDEEDYYQT